VRCGGHIAGRVIKRKLAHRDRLHGLTGPAGGLVSFPARCTLTVAGTPSIYAGDEQAFRGVKYERADGDAEIRPAFPDSPGDLAPDGWPVYRLHQDLIGLRRRHHWLVRSSTELLHLENQALAYRAVDPDGSPGLAVLLNISAADVEFPLASVPYKRLLASADDDGAPGHRVAPHGWAILELQPG
jgi:cyclomaltodextrinase / maltogenic alpha-amylase / neopullulanase